MPNATQRAPLAESGPRSAPRAHAPALHTWLAIAALVVCTAFVYAPSLQGRFVYDDLLLVESNPRLSGASAFVDAFRRSYWEGYDAESAGEVGYWRPSSTIALALGRLFGGGAPIGHHVVSVLLAAASAVAAFLFLRRLLRGYELAAFFGALLFALHPLHVESVAWISGVGDPLAATFVLLALERWLAWRERGSAGVPLASAAFALLAMLSKESGLAVLPLLLAVDLGRERAPAEREAAGLAARLRPFWRGWHALVVVVVLYLGARAAVFGSVSGGFDLTTTDFGVSAKRLLELRVELLGGFLALIAWPAETNLFRPFRPVLPSGALVVPLIAALVLLGLVVAAFAKRARPLLAALLLAPAALLPALVLVSSLGAFPLSDRYAYLAVIGGTATLAYAAQRFLLRPAMLAVLVAASVACAWRSMERIPDWRDEGRLFDRAVEQTPNTPYARWGLGRVLLERYRETRNPADLRAARQQYDVAMDLLEAAATSDFEIFATKRDHVEANLGLGWSLLFENELEGTTGDDAALKVFERVAESAPHSANARVGEGVALFQLGKVDEAAERVREALEIDPDSHVAHAAMGRFLYFLGDSSGATAEYRRALELRPGHLAYMLRLVQCMEPDSDDVTAMEQILHDARELHPDSVEPLRMLGTAAIKRGDTTAALSWLDQAIAMKPDDAYAHQLRGQLLAALGRNTDALKSFLRACELAPNSFEALFNTAAALNATNEPERAIPYLLRAYGARPRFESVEDDRMGDAIEAALLELAPKDAVLQWQLGNIDLSRGGASLDKALRWADRAIENEPLLAPAYVLRARLYLRDGESDEAALADFARAAELDPAFFDANYEYGIALMERGRQAEALVHLENALEALPESSLAAELRADIERTLKGRITALRAALGQ